MTNMNEHEVEVEKIADAFRKVLGEDEHTNNQRAILIKRIPIICQDVLTIKADLRWIRWFIMGIAGGIGLLIIMVIANKL